MTFQPGQSTALFQASQRIQQVQTPVIPVVASLIRQHPGTISLGQGVVAYPPPPEARAELEQFWSSPRPHIYHPVEGLPQLNEVLAGKLRSENGLPMGRGSSVVVTAGGNLAFMNAILAVTSPGDEVILPVPFYFNHEMAVTMAGCKPVLADTDDNYQLLPEIVRRVMTPRTRAVVTVSPNNPSGAVYPEAALRQVNRYCRDAGVFHIHDEAYEYFVYDQHRHFSPGSIPDSADHTISLYSLSKAYGFASWRIGYMAIPAGLIESIRKIQDTLLICPPVISQFAAIGALRAGREYCRAQLAGIARTRALALEELRQLDPICETPPTGGAFYFLLRLRRPLESLAVVERLIREFGVAVIPGTAFGLKDGCFLRVAYGALQPETVAEGLRRLVRGLQAIAD